MQNLKRLYQITSDSHLSFSEKMRALLQLGADYFQLEIGIVSHIKDDTYTIFEAISPDNALLTGTQFDVTNTYCLHTLATDQALSFYHAGKSDIAQHPCYANFGLESYIGAPIVVDGKRFGTINFSAKDARSAPFSEDDHSFIELLAHWVGNEISRYEKIDLLQEQQKALARQQELLEQMGQLAGVGAWQLDLINEKLFWSKVTKKIHEVDDDYQPDLATSLQFYKEGENQKRITTLVTKVVKQGGHFSGEFEIVTQKGNAKWVAVKGRAELEDGQCVRLVGAFQDITEQVYSRVQLENRHKELTLALEARSLFLANMSHEIRTPINGVLGMLQILEASPLTSKQQRFLALAKDSATSLVGIISDILDFTKIDSGKLTLEKVPIDLTNLLNNSVDVFVPLAQNKSIQLIKKLAPIDHVLAISDPTRLRQICANLLSNAIKFTHSGQVEISTELTLGEKNRGRLTIRVKDTGVGISEAQQRHLFLPFNQADVSTTRKYGGTGLGLSITRKICQLMGGDVEVSSELGQGSVFSAFVDIGVLQKSQDTQLSTTSQSEERDLSHLRVLVVEDNDINQIVIEEMLKLRNISCDIVNDGIEALSKVNEESIKDRYYSLILMDCQMPNMDGYQTTRHIRQLPTLVATVPIIALTANAMSEERDKCFACGMNEYLAKPVEQAQLYAMIEKFA
jgi:signal transduction histidine kinase/ActR/RegA family two-component response regulator